MTKSLNDLTEEEFKNLKIEFAPGCFDSFEGTQEELDELIAEIKRMVSTGEILEKSREINFDDPDEEDLDVIEHLAAAEANQAGRKLQ